MQAFRRVSDICGIDGGELDGEGGAWRPARELVQVREIGHACKLSFQSLFWLFSIFQTSFLFIALRVPPPGLQRKDC